MSGRSRWLCRARHSDELRAVGGLPGGQDERERAALAVGGEADLAGLPTSRASKQSGLQPESVSAPEVAPLVTDGITADGSPVLPLRTAPFDRLLSSSVAANSRG